MKDLVADILESLKYAMILLGKVLGFVLLILACAALLGFALCIIAASIWLVVYLVAGSANFSGIFLIVTMIFIALFNLVLIGDLYKRGKLK